MNIRPMLIVGIALLTAACSEDAQQARGFSLPAGDLEKGRTLFTEMHCNDCHMIGDISQDLENQTPEFSIELGGKVATIKAYGDLVTSVINPSHRIPKSLETTEVTGPDGESRMRNYNDLMTVQELIDLVTYLQSEYELMRYPETKYRNYHPYKF